MIYIWFRAAIQVKLPFFFHFLPVYFCHCMCFCQWSLSLSPLAVASHDVSLHVFLRYSPPPLPSSIWRFFLTLFSTLHSGLVNILLLLLLFSPILLFLIFKPHLTWRRKRERQASGGRMERKEDEKPSEERRDGGGKEGQESGEVK